MHSTWLERPRALIWSCLSILQWSVDDFAASWIIKAFPWNNSPNLFATWPESVANLCVEGLAKTDLNFRSVLHCFSIIYVFFCAYFHKWISIHCSLRTNISGVSTISSIAGKPLALSDSKNCGKNRKIEVGTSINLHCPRLRKPFFQPCEFFVTIMRILMPNDPHALLKQNVCTILSTSETNKKPNKCYSIQLQYLFTSHQMWFGLPNDAVVGAVEISSETYHRCDLRATHIRREILRFDRLSSACATKILCFIAVESNWNRTTTVLFGHRETRRHICIWIVCVDLARVAP